jgi:site-specific DNA-adenine methylase
MTSAKSPLKSPFPYIGGKSRIANEVWQRFGITDNYVEPFLGSAAMLLARPDDHEWWARTETANDADGMVSNFWRSV